jgi:uncharacterized membrane protein (UPF0136 family)
MIQTEGLRYVTVPTNRQVRFQHHREVLDRNSVPPHQHALGALQRWFVVSPVKFLKRFATVDAMLSAIPSHQHAAN